MEYKRFNNTIVARIDKGEEILEEIKIISLKEDIKLASICGLGATNNFTVGVLNTANKQYQSYNYDDQDYEITSIIGNISTLNNEYYSHVHMTCSNGNNKTVGGHLNRAIISGTCELFINIIDHQVDRIHDEDTGLNIFYFKGRK